MKTVCRVAFYFACLASLGACQSSGADPSNALAEATAGCQLGDGTYEELKGLLLAEPPNLKCAKQMVDGLSHEDRALFLGMLGAENQPILWRQGILYQIDRGHGREAAVQAALRHVNVGDFDPDFVGAIWKLDSPHALKFVADFWEHLVRMSRSGDEGAKAKADAVLCSGRDACSEDDLDQIERKIPELRAAAE